ncbi:alkylation response protein AidB-like acyl-CoA dehydrogenase [Cytobacillus horneckiae]|uniref:acyl-CoA dehydrogenase family protein n=1 Tax=Cytobacillus horneckiae TaxID=549687 RepID=UPI0019D16E5E|nr:acyl-CoA dehydrogenase family protein [Cytobacillus horneckiae]MBN6885786.1 acyl-CoA dehydrogenase family protein [Cytobacillus horneckiae]
MDFSYSESELLFQTELRTWLEENLPEGWLDGNRNIPGDNKGKGEFLRDWQRKLSEGGWAGISWPVEYGGRGATLIEEVIYEQEMARVKAPPVLNIIGTAMVGPTLLDIGTEEQKEKYVRKILNGEEIWCQGYSEPNAGSDLASLQTKAVKQGDKWIINGQKIWTSYAHLSDRCFLLARTENTGKKHEGITAFLVKMDQPGVETRGIRSINDQYDFNEVYLNDAVADDADIVGEVNNGWKVSLTLLSHERVGVARQTFRLQKQFDELVELAETLEKNGRPLILDPIVQQNLAIFRAKTKALLFSYYRHLTNSIRTGKPGPEGSMDKLASSELGQEMLAYAMSLQGAENTLWKEDALVDASWQRDYLRSFGYTIEGGTSEIQKNIVAERILGLPKDIKK